MKALEKRIARVIAVHNGIKDSICSDKERKCIRLDAETLTKKILKAFWAKKELN